MDIRQRIDALLKGGGLVVMQDGEMKDVSCPVALHGTMDKKLKR
jgi:hypothetical protein